jgi:hypothetical protein
MFFDSSFEIKGLESLPPILRILTMEAAKAYSDRNISLDTPYYQIFVIRAVRSKFVPKLPNLKAIQFRLYRFYIGHVHQLTKLEDSLLLDVGSAQ